MFLKETDLMCFSIASLLNTDIQTDRIMGGGSFSKVCSVRRMSMNFQNEVGSQCSSRCSSRQREPQTEYDGIDDEISLYSKRDTELPVDTSFRSIGTEDSNAKHYVMKQLRDDLSKEMRMVGSLHLAKEARFLEGLRHPNITAIYSKGEMPGSVNFFIVQEKLHICLEKCFRQWNNQNAVMNRNASTVTSLRKGGRRGRSQIKNVIFNERIDVLIGVASALEFLHRNKIIFRDMKPGNVGIGYDSTPKIFDFGIAKELKERYRVEAGKDLFHLTSDCGTRRYMAPEVYWGEPYGLSADVFCFVTLVWEVMMLIPPYKNMNKSEHENYVFVKNKRPAIKRSWKKEIKTLILKGWQKDSSKRPTMKDAVKVLQKIKS